MLNKRPLRYYIIPEKLSNQLGDLTQQSEKECSQTIAHTWSTVDRCDRKQHLEYDDAYQNPRQHSFSTHERKPWHLNTYGRSIELYKKTRKTCNDIKCQCDSYSQKTPLFVFSIKRNYKKNCLQSLSRPPQSFAVRESGFTIAEALATTVGCNDNYPSMKAESVHERHFVEDRSENEFPFRHRSHVGAGSEVIEKKSFFNLCWEAERQQRNRHLRT